MTEEIASLGESAVDLVGSYLALLESLVTLESPSGDAERNLQVAALVRAELERRGATVERHPAPGHGEHLTARFPGAQSTQPPLLVVGHMDTVHLVGSLARLPFDVDKPNDRISGPGAYDMKGGLATALVALDLIARAQRRPAGDLLFIITCDEEIGSHTSRALIERNAKAARGALVLEPCIPGGAAKTQRKGVGSFHVRVQGRPAHAGIEPEKGASAIHALVGLLEDVRRLESPEKGTTLNVGVIDGGTRSNVVAEHAHAEIDLRFWTTAAATWMEHAIKALTLRDPGCSLVIEGGLNRGALERTEASVVLFEHARVIAAAQGWTLDEGATGGASDGNLTSAVGCPTLDGLGPDGGGAHSLDEHVRLSDIAPRIALLAGLFLRL